MRAAERHAIAYSIAETQLVCACAWKPVRISIGIFHFVLSVLCSAKCYVLLTLFTLGNWVLGLAVGVAP